MTEKQKIYLVNQKYFDKIFLVFLGLYFIFNIISGVAASIPNVIIGIVIYRGLNRRIAAETILQNYDLNNFRMFFKASWVFTWKTMLAFLVCPAMIMTIIEPAP
jgi:hypothetical protein